MAARGDFLTIDPRAAQTLARKTSAIKVAQVTRRTATIASTIAPGSMKTRIRPIVTGGASPLGIVMVDHPAAGFVLRGTRPHDIRPKTKKVLRFTSGGQILYAKVVHHPGNKPNNFLWKALLLAREV